MFSNYEVQESCGAYHVTDRSTGTTVGGMDNLNKATAQENCDLLNDAYAFHAGGDS